jgi:hypothetical protein
VSIHHPEITEVAKSPPEVLVGHLGFIVLLNLRLFKDYADSLVLAIKAD